MKRTNKVLSLLVALSVLVGAYGSLLSTPAVAAGVPVTVSPASVELGSNGDITVSFTPATALDNGDSFVIYYSSEYGDADLDNTDFSYAVGSVYKGADAALTGITPTVSIAGNTVSIVLTTSGELDTTTPFTIVFPGTEFDTPATAQSVSFAVTTSVGDYGAALQYVGNDNDVTVTASVQPTLAFNIRNSADDADTNTCALGALTLAAYNDCAYRLKVSTNAQGGYTVQVTTDGDLRRSGSGDVADNLDIDPIAENGTITAGTEGYGILFDGGAITSSGAGGTVTESGDFADDDTPLPLVATDLYVASSSNNPGATDTTNTALVTHRAAIDANTNTGFYQQLVTYTVTASF